MIIEKKTKLVYEKKNAKIATKTKHNFCFLCTVKKSKSTEGKKTWNRNSTTKQTISISLHSLFVYIYYTLQTISTARLCALVYNPTENSRIMPNFNTAGNAVKISTTYSFYLQPSQFPLQLFRTNL